MRNIEMNGAVDILDFHQVPDSEKTILVPHQSSPEDLVLPVSAEDRFAGLKAYVENKQRIELPSTSS